jgi:predicted dehydrogenase
LALLDQSDGACGFLDSGGNCRIQPVKPHPCSDFPYRWNSPGFKKICRAKPVEVTAEEWERRINAPQKPSPASPRIRFESPKNPSFPRQKKTANNASMRFPQVFAAATLFLAMNSLLHAADLKIGLIGLDTSHATAFTEILNNPAAKDHVPGAKVVAAFKGGSPDIESSITRVEGYTTTLRDKHGVEIVDTIQELCSKVDAVMLLSVDGRPHVIQAMPVLAARKPLYIDKPMAGTLRDVHTLARLAAESKTPFFSSSSLRFAKTSQAVRKGSIGTVTNAWCGSPASLEKTHPDLFWYGVHGCESLFTVMGTGCESVRRGKTADGKIEVVGTWKGGRTGTFREVEGYQGKAQGSLGSADVGGFDGYAPLVAEAVKFFQTHVAPVPIEETLELFAFMEAADESKRRNGAEVKLSEVVEAAKKR